MAKASAACGAARRGSPYCHHHRVRCAGLTRSGVGCTVTSSSEHEHAAPLRKGEKFCAHHTPATTGACDGDENGFELYECDMCGELRAVRVGQECFHVCVAASEESDASDEEDGECGACGQLAAWCVCDQEWEYGADLSACNVSDEQLPCGVYRDENGELYDEDY